MVTLKQLAKELNVSVSTVSKALSDSHEISPKTKNKIINLAKEKNYVPNRTAVNLRSKKTKTIGVIIPNIFNHFYTKILNGIETEAKSNGYRTIVSISNEKYNSEVDGLTYFSNGSVDGILLAPSEESEKIKNFEHIASLKEKNIPFVLFDRNIEGLLTDKVIIDDYDSAKNAIEQFIKLKKKNITIISLIKNLNIGSIRKEGAKKADKNISILEFESEEELESELIKIFKSNKPIDAILALDELSGIISLNTARKLNINIPKELSIISFSQGILSKYSYPKLAIINQHAEAIGKESVKLLLNRFQNAESDFKTSIINSELELNQTFN